MLEIRRNTQGRMERLEAPEPGCWVHVVAPTDADLDVVRRWACRTHCSIMSPTWTSARASSTVGDVVLVVLNYPARRGRRGGSALAHPALTVLLAPHGLVTIAPGPTPFLAALLDGRIDRRRRGVRPSSCCACAGCSPMRAWWRCARSTPASSRLENALKRSLRNEEVLGLLDFQKSLTYFATGMKSNELVLERLQRIPALRWDEPGAGAARRRAHRGAPDDRNGRDLGQHPQPDDGCVRLDRVEQPELGHEGADVRHHHAGRADAHRERLRHERRAAQARTAGGPLSPSWRSVPCSGGVLFVVFRRRNWL